MSADPDRNDDGDISGGAGAGVGVGWREQGQKHGRAIPDNVITALIPQRTQSSTHLSISTRIPLPSRTIQKEHAYSTGTCAYRNLSHSRLQFYPNAPLTRRGQDPPTHSYPSQFHPRRSLPALHNMQIPVRYPPIYIIALCCTVSTSAGVQPRNRFSLIRELCM